MSFTKKKYGFNGSEIVVEGGILDFKYSLLPNYKVQNIKIRQNPYQWRRNLATLDIFTAGGKLSIPYIAFETAVQLTNQFIFLVEASKKKWM